MLSQLGSEQQHVHRSLSEKSSDIFTLPEAKMTREEVIDERLRPLFATHEVCVNDDAGHSAVCFFFLKETLPISKLSLTPDQSGRFIMCEFLLYKMKWRVICVYAPNNDLDRTRSSGDWNYT